MLVITEMTEGLSALLAPYGVAFVDGVWQSSNDAAVQAIVNAYDFVPEWRAARVASIQAECLSRIQSMVPGIDSTPTLEMVRILWLSIAPAARAPVAAMTSVINCYTASRTAVLAVNAATTKAAIDAVTVAWPAA